MDGLQGHRDDLQLKTDKVSFRYLMELTHFQASSPRQRKASGLRSLIFTAKACCRLSSFFVVLGKAGSFLDQTWRTLLTGQDFKRKPGNSIHFHCPSSILIPAQQGKLSCLLPTDLRAGAKTRERKQYWDLAAGTTAQGARPVPSTLRTAQLAGSTQKLRLEETWGGLQLNLWSKQGQPWGPNRLLRVLSNLVIKTSEERGCTTSLALSCTLYDPQIKQLFSLQRSTI